MMFRQLASYEQKFTQTVGQRAAGQTFDLIGELVIEDVMLLPSSAHEQLKQGSYNSIFMYKRKALAIRTKFKCVSSSGNLIPLRLTILLVD